MDVRTVRIPMRDGVELAATLYLPAAPAGAPDAGPVPALLEYLPYRKDDAMLVRDYELYSYMTRHGYAGARVDIRGTGASDGDLPDGEYSEQEQCDAEDVIDRDRVPAGADHLSGVVLRPRAQPAAAGPSGRFGRAALRAISRSGGR
jgi:dipeptidyl aminopeptidase/acylaminoacyl peptidase